ncbi:MAG: hypothetical protein HRT68_07460, partial [Flavobacteriaceae bacterium]|nr:hypothetical protein [Flavobacteriaceae bacterium]
MKKISLLLLAFTVTVSSFAFTNFEPKFPTNETKTITQEIGKLLQKPSFKIDEDIKANVVITLNQNNEMVVLSVDSQ